MMTNRTGGLSITAASNWMRAAGSLRALSFQGNSGSLACEKKLTADMYNNKLLYTASEYMEDSNKKVRDENIKRSFSIFA